MNKCEGCGVDVEEPNFLCTRCFNKSIFANIEVITNKEAGH